MNGIYYLEVNLICIALLLLMRSRLHTKSSLYSTDRLIFNSMTWTTVILCVSDIFSWYFLGSMNYGARFILEAGNLIYYEALVIIGFQWAMYVRVKLGHLNDLSLRKMLIPSIPLLIFTSVAISNPFTHFLFSIDTGNIYTRGPGIYLHWVITWTYLLVPTVKVAIAVVKAQSRMKKQELMPMLSFIAAPAVASLTQMLSYGITSSQVGITFSLLMVYIYSQDEQILTDSLTGLNNRRGFDNYISDRIARHTDAELSILMLDINGFKQVNDRLGHIVGDRALICAANILKKACSETKIRLFLCRYGGDEFLLCGNKFNPDDQTDIINRIRSGFAEVTDEPYTLSVSIGPSSGVCTDLRDAESLIRLADEEMYRDKMNYAQTAAHTSQRG